MSIINIQSIVVNDKGRVRGNNEDNFLLNGLYMHREKMDDGADITASCRDNVQIYAVCDGMGGTDAGEEASFTAVKMLSEKKDVYSAMISSNAVTMVLREISDEIDAGACAKGIKSGTTIAMLITDGSCACLSNVGDSRIYRFRNGKLDLLSVDHSRVQRMVSMGMMTPEQARTDPGRHIISQYLGMTSKIRFTPHFVEKLEFKKGDMFLLCSDGLTDMVADEAIEKILGSSRNHEAAARKLLSAALKNGGRDNTTVMVLNISQAVSGASAEKCRQRKKLALDIGRAAAAAAFAVTAADLIYYLIS